MAMRAKFVSEAFKEESDPIKDMHIGITPLMKQIEDNFDETNHGSVFNLSIFDEINAITVEIHGTIDHQMSGYNKTFYEVEVDGVLTLDPETKEISIDAKTVYTSGKMSMEYEDGENGEEFEKSSSNPFRDYEHASHKKGVLKQTFKNIHELMDALREAAE